MFLHPHRPTTSPIIPAVPIHAPREDPKFPKVVTSNIFPTLFSKIKTNHPILENPEHLCPLEGTF